MSNICFSIVQRTTFLVKYFSWKFKNISYLSGKMTFTKNLELAYCTTQSRSVNNVCYLKMTTTNWFVVSIGKKPWKFTVIAKNKSILPQRIFTLFFQGRVTADLQWLSSAQFEYLSLKIKLKLTKEKSLHIPQSKTKSLINSDFFQSMKISSAN